MQPAARPRRFGRGRVPWGFAGILGLLLLLPGSAPARGATPAGCLVHSSNPDEALAAAVAGSSSVAYQQFPAPWAGDAEPDLETAWFVTFDQAPRHALFVTSAWFKPGPAAPFVKVLDRTGLSEIFVRYPGGIFVPDLGQGSMRMLRARGQDAGRCGLIVGRRGVAVREVIDKGVLWKDGQEVVRGQLMALWAAVDVGNYNYVLRYEFHDDGTIRATTAATARNLPGRELVAHTHIALWRIDVDLGGAGGDSVYVLRHLEDAASGSWSETREAFNGGTEGALAIEATEFTRLQVAGGGKTYDLRPLYRGLARHHPAWMRHDLWATAAAKGETYYPHLTSYVADRQSVVDADIVLWHATPVLHVPRGEDGRFVDGDWQGVALAMPAGFELRPRDLFDRTPFHPAPAPADAEVEISFGASTYEVTEGGTVTVVVHLNREPDRAMDIDLTLNHQGGATASDYSGVPFSVRFDPGVVRREFRVSATSDDEDEGAETVELGFAALPRRVTGGNPSTLTIRERE